MISFNKLSTGLGYYLNPFANIWARYLLSLDNKATDYLAFSPRFFIIININNSNKDLEFWGSVLWSILLISIIVYLVVYSTYNLIYESIL